MLTIRGDILPVPNKEMLSLIKYSVKDILLTGDQSITDALSCCSSKNIFYQIAPWKENFANNLASKLPNRNLKRKKTACGDIDVIKYNSNYKNFLKKYDFRLNARPKLNGIIHAALERKHNKTLQRFEKDVLKSRNINGFKSRFLA